MLIAYGIVAVIAVAGLIWALNEHIPQTLGGPGPGITTTQP
jgi:hypothetical protein